MNKRCIALAAATTILHLPLAAATDIEENTAHADGYVLYCEMHCSETKLRTGVATITWVAPPGRAGTNELVAGGDEAPRIDVTVFADGFKQGEFVTFDRFGKNAEPRPAATTEGVAMDRRDLRAFDLHVESTSTGSAATATMPNDFEAPVASEAVSIEVENVEPGVRYSFRLRPPASDEEVVVTCEAPICPADMRPGGEP